jgi:mitotic spindle assembly checkpoint protein MAD2
VNSILFQRGIYPPESFTKVKKYGLGLLVTTDTALRDYIKNVVEQMSSMQRARPPSLARYSHMLPGWLMGGAVQQLVMVVTNVENKEVLERWCFKLDTHVLRDVTNQTYVLLESYGTLILRA